MLTLLWVMACSERGLEIEPGEPASVALGAKWAYVALGEDGLGVVDPETGATLEVIPPPEGAGSVDDLGLYNELLFALDARGRKGAMMVYRLDERDMPQLSDGPVAVQVGPYSGVSVHNGVTVVSGGAWGLSVFTYNGRGVLGPERSTVKVTRGQPDVLLSSRGDLAFVSSHFTKPVDGSEFGLTSLRLLAPPQDPQELDALGLPGAGFTAGTATPTAFPIRAAFASGRLLVAHGGGLSVVNIDAPEAMAIVTTLPLPVSGMALAVETDRAWVTGLGPAPAVVELDISTVDEPRILETLALPEGTLPTDIAARKGRIVVAGNGAGVWVDQRRPAPLESQVEFPSPGPQ